MGKTAQSSDGSGQVLAEILGDAETLLESDEGPNGPWHWGPLAVYRHRNRITVRDPDGGSVTTFTVGALPDGDAAYDALQERLDAAVDAWTTVL